MTTGQLQATLTQLPVILVWVAGIIIAINSRQRHPRGSKLTLIAFAFLLIQYLVGIFIVTPALVGVIVEQRLSGEQANSILRIWGFISSVIAIVPWALILTAIFGRRTTTEVASIETQDIQSKIRRFSPYQVSGIAFLVVVVLGIAITASIMLLATQPLAPAVESLSRAVSTFVYGRYRLD